MARSCRKMAVGERCLVNQEEISQQLQAAVALHNQGELDQAEVIYRSMPLLILIISMHLISAVVSAERRRDLRKELIY